MSKYSIAFEGQDGADIVAALGSLKLVTSAAKEGLAAIKGQPGEFLAVVIEENGEDGREVVRVRATEDIVTLVVNKRLKDEKAQEANATPAATAQTTETETTGAEV
jgi:hypothetical protein